VATDNGVDSAPTATAPCITPPNPPSDLTAPSSTSSSVTLSWATSSPHTGFAVSRSTDGTTYGSVSGTVSYDSATASYSFTDNTVQSGGAYYYQVQTVNGSLESAVATVSATTGFADPTNLIVTQTGAGSMSLTWSEATPMSGSPTFVIQRKNGLGTFATIGTSSTASFDDSGLMDDTMYTYQVGIGDSVWTMSESDTTLPAAPSGVTAAATTDDVHKTSKATVAWTNNSTNSALNSFEIYASIDGVHFSAVHEVVDGSTSWNDTSVTDGGSYWYKVQAIDPSGRTSVDSNIA
jgi:fibronectin type 3 domain-containing protein